MNYKDNRKYKLPAPEEIELNKDYTLSINPDGKDKFECYSQIYALCQQLTKYAMIKVRLEFSTKLKLHCHGTINIKNYTKIFPLYSLLWDHYKHFAIEISEIAKPEEWKTYCRKQRHIMKPYAITYNWLYHLKNSRINRKAKHFFSQHHRLQFELAGEETAGIDF